MNAHATEHVEKGTDLVYQATIAKVANQDTKIYIGMTKNEIKIRFSNHKVTNSHSSTKNIQQKQHFQNTFGS